MAITQSVCTTFKKELLQGLHDFTTGTGNAFKIALYVNSATLNTTTETYTGTDEVGSGVGYNTEGETLVNVTPTYTGTTAFTDFADVTWSASSITARGALIYNSTNGDAAVVVLDFGSDKVSSSGDFTIIFPTADATNAIIRIA